MEINIERGKPGAPHAVDEDNRATTVSLVSDTWETIYKTNCEIVRLMRRRSSMLSTVGHMVSSISGLHYFLGVGLDELESDFNDNGISGETVKRAVGALRNMLFDDSDEAFRGFSCVSIEFMSLYPEHMVEFGFTDGNHLFDVDIPDIYETAYTHGEGDNIDPHDPHLFRENRHIGELAIGAYTSRIEWDCHNVIFSSLDLDMTRKFLGSLVHDFDGVVGRYINTNTVLGDSKYPSLEMMFDSNFFSAC